MTTPVVRLRGVTVSYGGGHPALSDVDLDVEPGEVVAVLGANGSGKSTLIRAILGLAPVTTGTLELFGTGGAAAASVRRRLGYVPQRHTVGGGVPATVEEVVTTGRLAKRRLLPPLLSPVERGVVCDAIATVGLTDKIGHPVGSLSGGQQRRVLIARALAGEPDALVMDEPFAGVDLPNQEILARMLKDLASSGTTMIIVTHELGPIAPLVDRTILVEHGRIGYDGPPTPQVLSTFGGADTDPHPPSSPPPGIVELS